MNPPTVHDLPRPPAGREGWPWTLGGEAPGEGDAGEVEWPKISIVTPSYEQGRFLEETIRSVLLQGYPRLEYIVIDGGSTDRSREILQEYSPWLAHWRSEPDRGHYHALNEGFGISTGEVMAWINSDDKYARGAFGVVGEIFSLLPEVEWLTSGRPITWNAEGEEISCPELPGYSTEAFWRGDYGAAPFNSVWIQQESTFWSRALWERAGGGLDESLSLAGDFELWARFFRRSELHSVHRRLGGFRIHGDQKTAHHLSRYVEESREVFAAHGGRARSPAGALARRYIRRSPRWVRTLAAKVGWAYPAPIVVRDPGGRPWRVERRPA